MQVQTNKVGVFGRPGQFRWVAAYSGFPNTNGVGETKEEAIAQLEQVKRDRPEEFNPSEFLPDL